MAMINEVVEATTNKAAEALFAANILKVPYTVAEVINALPECFTEEEKARMLALPPGDDNHDVHCWFFYRTLMKYRLHKIKRESNKAKGYFWLT